MSPSLDGEGGEAGFSMSPALVDKGDGCEPGFSMSPGELGFSVSPVLGING